MLESLDLGEILEDNAEKRLKEYEESIKRAGNLRVKNIKKIWIEYDKQTDILYIYFGKEEAEESLMLENDIIVLVNKDELVGIVVNNFGQKYIQ